MPHLKQAVLTILSLLLFGTSLAQIPATISSAGTWSSSAGSGPITFAAGSCYTVTVTAWGGGGGGGGASNNGASGGGAGGGYAQAIITVGPGTYYYSVGAAGTAGTTAGTNGGGGGPTWFNGTAGINNNTSGSFINAGGGAGGNGVTTNAGAAIQTTVGTGTFGTSGLTATVSYSGGTGGGGFVNGSGDGGGGGGGGAAGAGGNGGNGATTITGGAGTFGCPNGGGGGGGGGGGATGAGANGNPGNSNGGGGTGGAANGGGGGGTANASAAGLGGNGTAGGAGTASGGGGGAGNGCCGCSGGAGGNGAPGSGSIGGGGGGGTGDGGGGNGGNGGAHGGGGAGADGSSTASGGTGGSGYLTITVTAITAPTATAGPALAAICAGATSAIMNGSVSAGATSTWSGGTGTWTNATDPVNATYTPASTETGTITLTLTATNACGTATATKTLTINSAPASPAVTSPVTYCQNATAVALTATGSNLLWYTVATGGTGSGTAPTPSTAAGGSTTYYVSQTQTGCESPRDSIVVTVIPSPTATANNTGPYCTDGTIVLTATGGNSYSWSSSNGYTGTGASPSPFSAATYGAGTFTYTVTVSAANGCTATASTNVVVNSSTVPVNVGVGANSLTPCPGDTLKLLGMATGATQWSWTGPGGFTSSVRNPIRIIPVTGTYTLTASNACGTAVNTASIFITVDNLSASISGTLSYCNGGNTTLTANPGGATSYTWSNGNSTISTSATVSGNPYQVTVIDASGCSASASATVSVDNPVASISGTLGFCQGGSTILTASGGTGYLWSDAANSTTQSITVSAAGPYSVTVTDVTGCTASTSATVISTTTPIPTVTSPVTYCQNATAVPLTATGSGSLLWYTMASGGTGSATAPTPSTAASGSTTYYVSQTQSGCEGPRASIVVTVNPAPADTASNTGPYCIGSSVTLSASGGTSYSWSGPNGYIGAGASPAPFSAATYGAGTYTVTVTDANSCTASANTAVVITTITTPISQTVCSGQSIIFNGQNLSTAGTYSDTLISAGGCDSIIVLTLTVVPVSSSAISQTICDGTSFLFSGQSLNTAGTYYDTLTNAAGCDSIIALTIDVAPKSVAGFSIQPAGDSLLLGTPIFVTNTSANASSAQWLLNNQAISLLAGNALPVSDTGLYCISIIASDTAGCSDSATQQCTYIYMNPPQPFYIPNAFTPNGDGINDFIEVYGNMEKIKYLSITIYDRWGEKVYQSFDSSFKWDGTFKGSPQPAGVFVYTLDITFNIGQSIHNKGGITLIR